jgi:L-seryl-tRNA(Ser) seleniumtransferase
MPGDLNQLSRRDLLGAAAAASLFGRPVEELGSRARRRPAGPDYENNVYTRLLGVRPHVPAHDHISRLGGGRMSREVLDAMAEANDYFVDMHELLEAAGRRAAELLGAEAAFVSAGGFSAMILGAAACLTGTDPEKAAGLPHPTWDRRECLIHRAHRFDYDRAYRAAGATIVTADSRPDLEAKLGERTAFIAAVSNLERQGVFAPPLEASRAPKPDAGLIPIEELIAIGKRARVPVVVDMASDLPPWGNLHRFLTAGADLLVLSGGKVIGGPQSSGLLVGRKDLIEAARLNANPNDNIGRGMKVGKEEVIGLIVALERFVKQDHGAEVARWDARARHIVGALQGIPGLTARFAANTSGFNDADLTWDETVIPLDRDRLRRTLADGHPRVQLEVVVTKDQGTAVWHATARTRTMRDGEEVLVARRLREVFGGAR